MIRYQKSQSRAADPRPASPIFLTFRSPGSPSISRNGVAPAPRNASASLACSSSRGPRATAAGSECTHSLARSDAGTRT